MIYRFSNPERIAFEAIYKAITRLETFVEINALKLDENSLVSIYTRAIAANPMGYCYDPTRIEYRYYGSRYIVYFNKLEQAEKSFIGLCSAVEFERIKIIEKASRFTKPYDKILSVYSYFVNSYEYCARDRIETIHHSSASQHLEGKGVCEGFSLAFSEIINSLGITCDIISGTSLSDSNQGDHMWNIVSLGSRFYHLDVTWDICTTEKGEAYDYFLLSDNDISRDHLWDISRFPQCDDASMDWYRTHGAYVNSLDDVDSLIYRNVSARATTIAFRYSDIFSTKDSIIQMINEHSRLLEIPVREVLCYTNEQCKTMSFKIKYYVI